MDLFETLYAYCGHIDNVHVHFGGARINFAVVAVVALLFYVHGKHLRSCRDGQLT